MTTARRHESCLLSSKRHPARLRFHMVSTLPQDFRNILRQETRVAHDQLDHHFTQIDIASRDGLKAFVGVHLACFQMMQARLRSSNLSAATLQDMINGLALDAVVLGLDHPVDAPALEQQIDPLAIDYLVAGSRLGSKVLSRRWAQSQDPLVQNAKTYFSQPSDPTLWPATCRALSDIPVAHARAAYIVKDARTLFQLFISESENVASRKDATL